MSKLTDADGEQAESQHWIDTATACRYLSDDQRERLVAKCTRVGQMLGTMIAEPDKWCQKPASRRSGLKSTV
ncbi:MAG: four helix bundle protein [Pyrinomonadaceae bacterium]|nr:four helix bundle protein [Pyrinomonadaceae bacterium]